MGSLDPAGTGATLVLLVACNPDSSGPCNDPTIVDAIVDTALRNVVAGSLANVDVAPSADGPDDQASNRPWAPSSNGAGCEMAASAPGAREEFGS